MMDDNGGTGFHQPPTSPTGFTDVAGSPIASSSGPPQKKSSTGEWSNLGARDESTGELIEDHDSLLTGGSTDNAWALGEPAVTGRGWEGVTQVNTDGDGEERMYDGNLVATSMGSFQPEEIGFEQIGDEDEDMRDSQHVVFVEGSGEQDGSSAVADAVWGVFLDESKSR